LDWFDRIKSVKVFINGETKEISGQVNLLELLKVFSLPSERIAIELNREVVRKKDWESILIRDADKIEIVHFVGGG
jgi:sulfur carrier protein